MFKKKIFNDPVYGFVTIQRELLFKIIEHPFFQRLRRIKQLGLTDLVYPGALHSRFHHAIGAMHLMSLSLDQLRGKGHEINESEYEASLAAILLHDIGHGPFSHALEFSLLNGIRHEELSLTIMEFLNQEFDGALSLALKIFKNEYERSFFNQLVSSQLDIDRLDYLRRDSFYTGVYEGMIGVERLIHMLDVRNNEIVIEEKGIYSIENFLHARRFMYWQVYLHKAAVSAEKMLINIIKRAKFLIKEDRKLFATPPFRLFLESNVQLEAFRSNAAIIKAFASLDDYDIWGSIKVWSHDKDEILSTLCNMLLERRLFRVKLFNQKVEPNLLNNIGEKISDAYVVNRKEADYFLSHGIVSNAAYLFKNQNIGILMKDNQVIAIDKVSDLPNIKAMSKIVKKYYVCWPKFISL